MTDHEKNPAAVELGRLGGKQSKGKPKRYTPEERKRRAERLAEARKKRWAKSETPPTQPSRALLIYTPKSKVYL